MSKIYLLFVTIKFAVFLDTKHGLKEKVMEHYLRIYFSNQQDLYLQGDSYQLSHVTTSLFPTSIYLFKVDKRNTKANCEICSKLTVKTLASFWCFIVNFEHISHLFLVFLLLTLSVSTGLAKHQKSSNIM